MNNCEGDLTGADLDELDPESSAGVLSRAAGSSTSSSLYSSVDSHRSYSLNTQPVAVPLVVRPYHTRHQISAEHCLVSLDEESPSTVQVLVHIVFSELVKIRAIVINTGRGEESPRVCRVWTNRPTAIDFDQTDTVPTQQEFELSQSEEAIEYPTRLSRFGSVSSLTFEFRSPSGGDRIRFYFLGFLGETKNMGRDPSSQLSVGAQNSADAPIDSMREHAAGSHTTIR